MAWLSKKQGLCGALGGTEAEYVALCLSSLEAVYLKDILADIFTWLRTNPLSCMRTTLGVCSSPKTMCYMARPSTLPSDTTSLELVNDGVVAIKQCSTLDQLADFFTHYGTLHFLQLRRRSWEHEHACT